ncbi:hypothetical protein MMC07_000718 [Pseudocyphellaria aurata]|nr:hypothetical protein [Pseudocyphellaria aurata]
MPSFTAGNNRIWGATSRTIARQVRGDDRSDRGLWSAPVVVGAPITAAAAAMFSPTRPHLGKVTPASPRGPRNRRRIQSLLTGEFFTITTAPKRPKRLLRSGPIGAPADQLRWRVCDEYPWRCRFVEQWAWERVEAIEEIPTPLTQSSTPATMTEEERWSTEGSSAGAHPEIRETTTDGSGVGILPEIIDLTIPTPTNSGVGILPEIIDLTIPTPTNSGVGIPPEIIDLITPTTSTTFPEIIDLVTPTPTTDRGFPEIVDLITPTTPTTTTTTDPDAPEIVDLVTLAPLPEIVDLVTPAPFPEIIDLVTPTTDGGFLEIVDLITPTPARSNADDDNDNDRASPEIIDLITPTMSASTYDRP